jgi:hypothetical protein
MTTVEELIAMPWGIYGITCICTGMDGEGVIMCDTSPSLASEEAAAVARHIVDIHNRDVQAKIKNLE